MSKDNETGYKKPPKKSQFKKGKSGNPAGRPKGSLNMEAILDKVLAEPVTMTEGNGRKRKVSLLEGVITKQAAKAATDASAFKTLMHLILHVKKKELIEGIKEPLPWHDEGPY